MTPPTLDQRLADAAEWCRQRPEAAHIAAVIDEARDRITELNIEMYGGCGCPAPFDQCEHDEPLLDRGNRLIRENERLRDEIDTLMIRLARAGVQS